MPVTSSYTRTDQGVTKERQRGVSAHL